MEIDNLNALDEEGGSRATVRQLARTLAVASQSASLDALEGPKLDIARLTIRVDPDSVDATSADFRFGAAEALSAVVNGLAEQVLSTSTSELLLKSQRARVLTGIAASSGATQKALAADLKVKESNLSKYVRELASAGLIEPAAGPEPRGKAWALSPWGVKTFFSLVSGPFASRVPSDELADGLRGARLREMVLHPDGVGNTQTIPKDEVYRRLEEALDRKTSEPLRLTTLFAGDLRTHERPWRLHERVFKGRELCRPVEWVLVEAEGTEQWLTDLLDGAEGNSKVTAWTRPRSDEVIPTVQVLDGEGLMYPLPPNDSGLVSDKQTALKAWQDIQQPASLRLQGGQPMSALA